MNEFIRAAAATAALAISSAQAATPTAMREGGYVLAPFSFAKFCLDYPGDCPQSAGPARVHLTSARMAELTKVNSEVNETIDPTPNTSSFRLWKLGVSAGDCNNFAVQKRHELISRGWPAAALALTVVKTPWGEGHLVVTVRTDDGDFVLDNLRSAVVRWQAEGYRWIMRQSERNPQYWVDLDGGRASPVLSTRVSEDSARAKDADTAGPRDASQSESKQDIHALAPTPQTANAEARTMPNTALTRGARWIGAGLVTSFGRWIEENGSQIETALDPWLPLADPVLTVATAAEAEMPPRAVGRRDRPFESGRASNSLAATGTGGEPNQQDHEAVLPAVGLDLTVGL